MCALVPTNVMYIFFLLIMLFKILLLIRGYEILGYFPLHLRKVSTKRFNKVYQNLTFQRQLFYRNIGNIKKIVFNYWIISRDLLVPLWLDGVSDFPVIVSLMMQQIQSVSHPACVFLFLYHNICKNLSQSKGTMFEMYIS